ncbi:unnamed protein product [Caenorhabditis bovis]|uniref:Uncharacterized protein n=1 Tax=Caenorhabditis bovis TaxID=2654633 RepID=A0A8S1FBE8_9PELO|nr:unnamed protein product [Caenorhabditis bovis]
MLFKMLIAFALLAAVCEASVGRTNEKAGSTVRIDSVPNSEGIRRTVAAGEQIFDFKKGYFVDAKGKKIEGIDQSNYHAENGTLIIKKISKSDAGSYVSEPNNPIISKQDDGTFVGLAGPQLIVTVE